MKLFVVDRQTKKKIFLDINARNRAELANRIGRTFTVKGKRYTIHDVKASADNSNTVGGVVVGALFGILAGPGGVALGGAAGGLIGGAKVSDDKKRAQRFNRDRV